MFNITYVMVPHLCEVALYTHKNDYYNQTETENNKCGNDVEKWKPLHIAGENVKCCSQYRNCIAVSEKDKHRITI